jgi:Zn finger protein HypA/HybF involved in hydrogenase expression
MPLSIKCPHCRATLEAEVEEGQVIRCPACKKQFKVDSESQDNEEDSLANNKYLVPLGYAAFVGLPILITIAVVFSLGGKKVTQPEEDTPHVAKSDSRSSSNVPKKTPKRGPPQKQSSDKFVEPERKSVPSSDSTSKAGTTNNNTETNPKPDTNPGTPLETIALEIAPRPHEILWKLPLSGFESDWKHVGAVDVRIGGLAIAKANLIDSKNNVTESQTPFLVAIIDVRKNEPKEKRTLESWTYFNTSYAAMFLSNDKALPNGILPPATKLLTKTADKQLLPDDGSHVKDILLFAVPADDAGELNLRLDAERVGEKGDIWFKIPSLAWKKQ